MQQNADVARIVMVDNYELGTTYLVCAYSPEEGLADRVSCDVSDNKIGVADANLTEET